MWIYIATEVLIFAALFTAYFAYRIWYPEAFAAGVNPDHVHLFLVFYYSLTGIHAAHMLAGLVWISGIIYLAKKGRFSAVHYMPVEILALYWHFVDIVWIFLLPLLYLTGPHSV